MTGEYDKEKDVFLVTYKENIAQQVPNPLLKPADQDVIIFHPINNFIVIRLFLIPKWMYPSQVLKSFKFTM